MKQSPLLRILVCLIAILFIFYGSVNARISEQTGTIRGTVRLDTNGDGQCATGDPVSGVNIRFEVEDFDHILFSGSNGTFGMPAASQGPWTVTAQPGSQWSVTSTNPLSVLLNLSSGVIQTNIDFCVSWQGVGDPPTGILSTAPSPLTRSSIDLASVESDPSTIPSQAEVANVSIAELSQISTELLEDPPASEVPDLNSSDMSREPIEQSAVNSGEWLDYVNAFREMSGLPLLIENESLSAGAQLHSQFMVINDVPIAHSENPSNPLFTEAGDEAAENALIFATPMLQANHVWATNFWVSGPFHLLPMLDPALSEVGFGIYNQDIGNFSMAAVLDVSTRRELDDPPSSINYPILFPGEGTQTWIVRHSLYEWPDPIQSCPGYSRPIGTTIVAMLGDGDRSPSVSSHSVRVNGNLVESCLFTETTYNNAGSPDAQSTGRTILDKRDAVVILPRNPLPIDSQIDVSIEVDGETISWSYFTVKEPPTTK